MTRAEMDAKLDMISKLGCQAEIDEYIKHAKMREMFDGEMAALIARRGEVRR